MEHENFIPVWKTRKFEAKMNSLQLIILDICEIQWTDAGSFRSDEITVIYSDIMNRGVNRILTLGGVRDFCPAKLETALRKMRYIP